MRPDETNRDRLIRFIQPWIDARPRQYAPRVGYNGCGYGLSTDDLTDSALTKLAAQIAHAFWLERQFNHASREFRAGRGSD